MEKLIIPRKLQSLETHCFIKDLLNEWLKEREVTLKDPKVSIVFESDKDIISIKSDKDNTYIMEERLTYKNTKIIKELWLNCLSSVS